MNYKNNTIIKMFIALMLLNISLLFNMNYLHADSGFDSSYDSSGSSWDSSSSYDYSSSSYDYDYGSSSGGGSYSGKHIDYHFDGAIYVIVSIILTLILNSYMKRKSIGNRSIYLTIIIALLYILGNILYGSYFFITCFSMGYFSFLFFGVPIIAFTGKRTKGRTSNFNYFESNGKFDDLNTNELQTKLFNIYKDVQIAWSNNNLGPVRSKLSDELYNSYQMQIDSLIQLNQRNVMDDIEFHRMIVTNDVINGNAEELYIRMEVTCRDYIVQNKNGKEKVVRGNPKYLNDYIYMMTFVRTIDGKVDNCPNCGAKLDSGASSICSSCKSVVVHGSDNWVLTKKKMLEQTRR